MVNKKNKKYTSGSHLRNLNTELDKAVAKASSVSKLSDIGRRHR